MYTIRFNWILFNLLFIQFFQIFFCIWPPLSGGYLHHNILTCNNNTLTTETASPNNKTYPYSYPLTLYYSLILWGVISEQLSEINGFFLNDTIFKENAHNQDHQM